MWSTTFASSPWQLWLAAGSAAAFTLLLTPLIRAAALRSGCVDRPSADRWAQRVVPRLGGVALFLGAALAMLLWVRPDRSLAGVLAGLVGVFLLGVVDDVRRLRPYTKLLWQLAVGCLLVMSGVRIELIRSTWLSIPLTVCWVVLVMNAFNLLDNMDGLAAGVGAIAAGFSAIHAALMGQWTIATLASIVSGACLGFLRYNFPPAKIYMGDAGSHLLGLSLSVLSLLGPWHYSTQLLSIVAVPAMVLAVPIFDTCFVALQRLLHRTHPFQGGTDHVSHRLAILGLSQRQTVVMLYAASAALGALSLLSLRVAPLTTIAIWLLVLAGILLVGAYLAKVKVYEVKREPVEAVARPSADSTSTTLIETMLLHKRRLLEVLIDFSLISSAYVGAYMLRFDAALPPALQRLIVQSLPVILAVKLACFSGFGLYRGMWRYASVADVLAIFKAVTIGSIGSSLAVLYLWRFEGYSRAVFIIDWLLLFLTVSASRVAERLLNEGIASVAEGSLPVLIIGAGDTGEFVLRQMRQGGGVRRRVVGFLDDDPLKQGSRIHGRSVLGTRDELSTVLQVYEVREVFIAMGSPPADLIRHVQQACEPQGIRWKVVSAAMAPEP